MAVEIGALRALLSLDSAAFEKGAKRAQTSTQKMRDQFKKLAKIGASAFAAVSASAFAGARDIDATAKAARRLDASIGGFEALKLSAAEAGVTISTLPKELQSINRELASIGTSGNADRALERLGIQASELDSLDADEKIAKIADRVEKLGLSSGEATALLRDLGVRNREFVLLLQQGGDAIREARNDVEEYGLALSGPVAAAIEAGNDQIGRLTIVGRVFSQQMARAIIPAVGRFAEKITDSVKEGGQLRVVINVLANVGRGLAKVIDLVVENLDFLIDLFKVFVAAKTITFVAALGRSMLVLARSIRATGLVMVAFTSIARAKITAIALLGAVIAKATGTFDDFAGFVKKTSQSLFDMLPPELKGGIEELADRISGLGESLDDTAEIAAFDFVNAELDASEAANSFGKAARGASKGVERLGNDTESAAETAETAGRQFAEGITDPIKRAFKSGELNAKTFADVVQGTLGRLRDRLIDEVFKPIEDAIFEAFSGKSGGGGGGGILGSIAGAIGGALGGGGPSLNSKSVFAASSNFIGQLDSGGRIGRGQSAIVGERRPEIVTGPANVTGGAETARMFNGNAAQRMGGNATLRIVAPEGFSVQQQGEIQGIALEITSEGLSAYDRETLPSSFNRIRKDPDMIG